MTKPLPLLAVVAVLALPGSASATSAKPITLARARSVFVQHGFSQLPNLLTPMPQGEIGDFLIFRKGTQPVTPSEVSVFVNALRAKRFASTAITGFHLGFRVRNVVLIVDLSVDRADRKRQISDFKLLGKPTWP